MTIFLKVSFECLGATPLEASVRCWTAGVSQGPLAATLPFSRKSDYRTSCLIGNRATVVPKPPFQRLVSRQLWEVN